MVNMLSFIIKSPDALLEAIGARAKAARLALALTRASLAARSGVPESTIKRFELTGKIGTYALVDIAIALDMADTLETLFAPKPVYALSEMTARKRQRGRL